MPEQFLNDRKKNKGTKSEIVLAITDGSRWVRLNDCPMNSFCLEHVSILGEGEKSCQGLLARVLSDATDSSHRLMGIALQGISP